MNTEYRGIKISEDTKFENMDFVQYDFSMSDLSEVVFENVNFSNCTFDKTVCKKTKFWSCFFEDCIFSKVDLSDTYIGAWGGGQNNCKFIKCKLGKTFDSSYITNVVFDHCKIKGCMFFCLYMERVRFIGLIDDLMIRKMSVKEITQHQTPAKATEVIAKILRIIKQDSIDVPKVQVKDIDFSSATMQFLDFSECELQNIIPPANDRHLLIDKNLYEITKSVSDQIKKSWYNTDNQSWALNCVKNIQEQTPVTIVCWHDFKHFENEEFADRLMELFRRAKKDMDDNRQQPDE